MLMHSSSNDKLDQAIDALNAQGFIFAKRFIQDGRVRTRYRMQIGRFTNEIVRKVKQGILSPEEGAQQASIMRNEIMNAMRLKSSDVSRSIAIAEKRYGMTLPHLKNKYAHKNYFKEFSELNDTQKKDIWMTIINKSKEASPQFNRTGKLLYYSGRTLLFLTFAAAAYKIINAKNKVNEAEKQSVVITGSYVGSALGGAYAGGELGGGIGVLGGPFDPLTVPLGVFLGGLIGGSVGLLSRML